MNAVYSESGGGFSAEMLIGKPEFALRLLPAGGSTGQALVKKSAKSYDTEWKSISASSAPAPSAVPDYVIAAAEETAAKVSEVQSSGTLSFIAISDTHHSTAHIYADQMAESLLHLSQGAEELRRRLHLDFAAHLGDTVWDGGETPAQAKAAMREVNAALFPAFNGLEQFRAAGNHDCLYNSGGGIDEGQIFAHLCAFSGEAAAAPSGFCFKDFERSKIRVICLNTAENGDGEFFVSTEQLALLKAALDISALGEGWKSIVLSHHPLDWLGGETAVMGAIAAAKGLLCNVHGHVHNFAVSTLGSTGIARIAIPNASYYRCNEYSVESGFGQATTYAKVSGTAEDSALCIVTVDPEKGIVYAHCYGAGYDRAVDLSDPSDKPIDDSDTGSGEGSGGTESGGEGEGSGDDDSGDEGESAGYTNLVLTAQAIDSAEPYNGCGYKNGVYLSSSSPFEGTDSSTVTTGYIPYTVPASSTAVPGTIYIKGAAWEAVSHCRMFFFTASKYDVLSLQIRGNHDSPNGLLSTHYTIDTLGENYIRLTPVPGDTYGSKLVDVLAATTDTAYIRFSLVGSGENLIITVDEPIE